MKKCSSNLEFIVRREIKVFPKPMGKILDQRVISTPNGQGYGINGHVPCDHVLHVQYERGHSTFDGALWTHHYA